MNSKMIAVIFSALAILACGMQTQAPSQLGLTPSSGVSLPVKAAEMVELTDTAPVYVTTAPLNVRSEANASSQILGVLEAGTVVTVFILDIRGDDCYTGEWLAIDKPIAGYVCSLYIEEKK